ncbi:hypothetical protein DTO045G8_5035 [Paecilomyces variotii]|nr:hypothetical protein DTO045G8_5035 [Paecilomyces variotii]
MGLETLSQQSSFSLLNPSGPSILAPRLGSLHIAGRKPQRTPHYVPITSRGTVPHVAHDVMRDHVKIDSIYIGLEDFLQKAHHESPVYKLPTAAHESPLRKFIAFPKDVLLVLGPRRIPPIVCPTSNTENSISIMTSVGFRQLEAGQYIEAIQKLRPDIAIGLSDLVLGAKPGAKRRMKMVDRTHAYTRDATERLYGDWVAPEARDKALYFAPVLPLENTQQQLYLQDLAEDLRPRISGLALYDSASLSIVPEELGDLPRLSLSEYKTPHDILRDISLGADLVTIPFLSSATDGGIALDFTFPAPASSPSTPLLRPLAFDMWSPSHTTDLSPITPNCQCYTCTKHHRAYIRHLLSAKEMLAWTLIQIHNFHTIDLFFTAIRNSIEKATFDEDIRTFSRVYESELPRQTGTGPRLRGYQLPASGPGQPKRNPRAYGRLDDAVEKYAESISSVTVPDAGADELQDRGFAEKKDGAAL